MQVKTPVFHWFEYRCTVFMIIANCTVSKYFKIFFAGVFCQKACCTIEINVQVLIFLCAFWLFLKRNTTLCNICGLWPCWGPCAGGWDDSQLLDSILRSTRCKIQKVGNPKRNLYHNILSITKCLKMYKSFLRLFRWFFKIIYSQIFKFYSTPPLSPSPSLARC